MLKITLVTVGKLKEKAARQLIEEYSKRLKVYCKLTIVELEDEKCPEKFSDKEKEQVIEKEGKRIEDRIPRDALVIPLVIEGKQLSSEKLASQIQNWQTQGTSHLCFIIGGSLGLSSQIQERGKLKLSFSLMTFPHQIMRILLLEQIYRSFRILRNEPYHK